MMSAIESTWSCKVSFSASNSSIRSSSSSRVFCLGISGLSGDAGIQIFVDAAGWQRLEVFDPNGQKIFDVLGSNGVGNQGVTELFFENAEPSFAEQSLDELFARFPAGNYTFKGRTVDGQTLNGKAPLKHSIPAGPEIVSPVEGAVLDPAQPVVIDWEPVANPFPGTPSAVSVVGYQVIVEQVKPQPLRVFSANLPSTVTGNGFTRIHPVKRGVHYRSVSDRA
jgi:hypothetical protein